MCLELRACMWLATPVCGGDPGPASSLPESCVTARTHDRVAGPTASRSSASTSSTKTIACGFPMLTHVTSHSCLGGLARKLQRSPNPDQACTRPPDTLLTPRRSSAQVSPAPSKRRPGWLNFWRARRSAGSRRRNWGVLVARPLSPALYRQRCRDGRAVQNRLAHVHLYGAISKNFGHNGSSKR